MCSLLWKSPGKYISLERLAEEYGVVNEHPHDARGDSKALAQCISIALRQGEKLPICSKPLSLGAFSGGGADRENWAARENWIGTCQRPRPKLALRASGNMDIRVSLDRGPLAVSASVKRSASSDHERNVRPKTNAEEESD
jgi:DNA polymerase III epsilon subunit-like protein